MRTWLHILAAVMALAGHLVGVVGLPLPSAAPAQLVPPVVVVKKTERACHCACGGGCGTVCCCCGDSAAPAEEPSDPPADKETSWHWVASIQVQKCHGIGPAGTPDLPPGLPAVRSVNSSCVNQTVESIRLSPIVAVAVSGRPPTPPPRSV